ncbi:uracil-DNA glycosylase [Haliangium sp.]|uniref:uracil-DNA glycosylase n=1 Tax=Haliangium sp. TaxID=2663208 RepID=UPI003D151903
MTDLDPHRELSELVRAFRVHLEVQRSRGAYAAEAAPMPVPSPALVPSDLEVWAPAARSAPVAPAALPGEPSESPSRAEMQAMLADVSDMLDEPRRAPVGPARPAASAPAPGGEPVPQHRASRMSLADIRAELGDCRRCKLAQGRSNIVFGVGAPDAALMFVGEAPGFHEDRQGEPFVGAAGQLLDRMIEAMGWSRDSVYIANVLKCRPPQNRDPEPDEIAACQPFLAKQIEAVAPRVIVSLGRPAARLLLDSNAPMHALRGRFRPYRGVAVMPTFHPAYLLRNPERKRETWDDLKQVIAELTRLGVRSPRPPKA